MTKYVTTRYYRAPELYLSYESNYSAAVDMWSMGCIIAEFFTKKLFVKAATTEEYLEFLVSILGVPSPKVQNEIRNKNFLNYILQKENTIKRKSFKELIPNAPDQAIDLIQKLMTYDPAERISASDMMKHPFLEELFDPKEDAGICKDPINYFDFEFEQYSINTDILKELILDEIIMANSQEATRTNQELSKKYKNGVLELIFERMDTESKQPGKSLTVDTKIEKTSDAPGEQSASTNASNASPQKNVTKPPSLSFGSISNVV